MALSRRVVKLAYRSMIHVWRKAAVVRVHRETQLAAMT
jgi:hypothetical protein